MMRIKSGVSLLGFHPEMVVALMIAAPILMEAGPL